MSFRLNPFHARDGRRWWAYWRGPRWLKRTVAGVIHCCGMFFGANWFIVTMWWLDMASSRTPPQQPPTFCVILSIRGRSWQKYWLSGLKPMTIQVLLRGSFFICARFLPFWASPKVLCFFSVQGFFCAFCYAKDEFFLVSMRPTEIWQWLMVSCGLSLIGNQYSLRKWGRMPIWKAGRNLSCSLLCYSPWKIFNWHFQLTH